MRTRKCKALFGWVWEGFMNRLCPWKPTDIRSYSDFGVSGCCYSETCMMCIKHFSMACRQCPRQRRNDIVPYSADRMPFVQALQFKRMCWLEPVETRI